MQMITIDIDSFLIPEDHRYSSDPSDVSTSVDLDYSEKL